MKIIHKNVNVDEDNNEILGLIFNEVFNENYTLMKKLQCFTI